MTHPYRTDARPGTNFHLQGCGAMLQLARESSGLSLESVSSQLKIPERALKSIEAEDWEQLGAPVFMRGQLRSYARLLKVDVEPYLQQDRLRAAPVAELVSHSHVPRYRRMLDGVAKRAVYLVITAAIAVPVWLAVQKQQGSDSSQTTASLDVVPTANPVAPEPAPKASPASAQPLPYLASLAPVVRASENVLTLRMRADSWVQVQAPDGSRVEQGIVNAGELRSYKAGEVGKVVLGNAAAVEVQQAGSTVDMTTYQRANVVRFTVSSDGSLAPVID